jgi:ADP-ribose pyrophosphatase YjhB (NUDIX family)
MARTDHYHDPNAPKATNIVVAVTAFVQDHQGRLLMIRRTDNDLYSIPAGIDVEPTDLIGVYSDPAHVISYTDGEVRQQFSICFRAHPTGGELHTSNESSEVHWVEHEDLARFNIHPSIRLRIEHGFQNPKRPFFTK